MTDNKPSELVEKVARAICRAYCKPSMAQSVIECQVENGWDMWVREAQAAIAAYQHAPDAVSEDVGDEFIAEVLRLTGYNDAPECVQNTRNCQNLRHELTLAHAATLQKLADLQTAYQATAEAAAIHLKAAMAVQRKLAMARGALAAIQSEAQRERSLDHHLRRCAIVQTGKALAQTITL